MTDKDPSPADSIEALHRLVDQLGALADTAGREVRERERHAAYLRDTESVIACRERDEVRLDCDALRREEAHALYQQDTASLLRYRERAATAHERIAGALEAIATALAGKEPR